MSDASWTAEMRGLDVMSTKLLEVLGELRRHLDLNFDSLSVWEERDRIRLTNL
jgi:hypothetical protein